MTPNIDMLPSDADEGGQPASAGCAASPCSPSDPFVRHEVMDRASILLEMLERSLGEHPGMANGQLREIYERAGIALADLYEEAGRISFEENADGDARRETHPKQSDG